MRISDWSSDVCSSDLLQARSDAEGGLAVLAPIDSPAKRTAALQIVLNRDGPEGMAAWADNAGIGLDLLDADGKHILLTSLMQAQRWEDRKSTRLNSSH